MLKVVERTLMRALESAGALTLMAATAAVGVAALLVNGEAAGWIGIAVLGIAGFLEVAYRQAKASLAKRQHLSSKARATDEMVGKILAAHPTWDMEVVSEFTHGGLKFRSLSCGGIKPPLTVTEPLCPECGGSLAERARVNLITPPRIEFLCLCGFRQRSRQTLAELKREALDLAGTPR